MNTKEVKSFPLLPIDKVRPILKCEYADGIERVGVHFEGFFDNLFILE